MKRAIVNQLSGPMCSLAGLFFCGVVLVAQNASMPRSIDITVQVLDGRNGKPIPNQRLLVFVGKSSEAARSHAEHTDLTTGRDGLGMLRLYPDEAQWIQVWADGRVLCYPDPNQSSLRVDTIMSTGFVTPNTCSDVMKAPKPGHLIVFARPARFMEKMKR